IASLAGRPVDGDVLAKDVPVADLQVSRLALVFAVLGIAAEYRALPEKVIGSHRRTTLDRHMGVELGSGPENDAGLDVTVGTDLYIVGQLCARMHERERVNFGQTTGPSPEA